MSTTPIAPVVVMVTGLFVKFHTKNDDKDSGERVSATVLAGAEVVAAKTPLGDPGNCWRDQTDQPSGNDAQWGGKPGWFRLDLRRDIREAELSGMRLRIEKEGNNGWNFCVVALASRSSGTDRELLDSEQRRLDDQQGSQEYELR